MTRRLRIRKTSQFFLKIVAKTTQNSLTRSDTPKDKRAVTASHRSHFAAIVLHALCAPLLAVPQLFRSWRWLLASVALLFGAVTFVARSFRSAGYVGKFVLRIKQVPGQITSRKTNLSIDNKYQIPPTASPEMHFGSLPVEILSLILPSHGKLSLIHI